MDRTLGETFYIMFTTRAFSSGVPTTLAGTPVVSAYEDNSLTQITAGITLGVDHDSVTGLNLLTIVATGANGYEAGKDYNLVITTGTVDSVSVVGEVVGTFSLGLSAAFTRIGAAGAGLTEAGGTGDHLTAIPWNASWDAEVQSECADALTAYDPPTNAEMEARTLVAANYATAAALATVDGNVDLILEDTGTTLPATLATIAGYVDTEIAGIISTLGTPAGISISADIAALPTAAENRAEMDSNSTQLAAIVADTNELQTNQGNWLTATGFSTHSAADVWSVPTRILTANTNLNDPTAAQIRAEIDSNSTQLVAILSGVITGQAQTGTLSTTQATTNLSGYADDQLIGRVIIWTSGNCEGEATDITDYASASGLLTFTALTTAPANGDTFKIV